MPLLWPCLSVCQGRGAQPGWALRLSGDVPVPCQTSYIESLGASVLREWMKEEECTALALRSVEREKVLVSRLCPTLCGPMDHSPTRLTLSWDSSEHKTGVIYHSFSRGYCRPRIKPSSPALQADLLLSKSLEKPLEDQPRLSLNLSSSTYKLLTLDKLINLSEFQSPTS